MKNLIVVLMGGLSGERKISFLTGKASDLNGSIIIISPSLKIQRPVNYI
jgi:hypothetical protein